MPTAHCPYFGNFMYEGHPYQASWAYNEPEGKAFLAGLVDLHKAGKLGALYCACNPRARLPLIPYIRGKKCFLMRVAGQGLEHTRTCGKHGATHHADGRPICRSAFERLLAAGEIRIDEPLAMDAAPPCPSVAVGEPREGESEEQRPVTLKTLADVMFTMSRLDGNARRGTLLPDEWREVASHLRVTAWQLWINDVPGGEVIAIPRRDDGGFEEVLHRFPEAQGPRQRFAIALGVLSGGVTKLPGADLRLGFRETTSNLRISATLWEQAIQSCAFPNVRRLIAKQAANEIGPLSVMLIGRAQMTASGDVRLVSARLVVLGRVYIPIDSMLEHHALARLVLEGRRFLKPLLLLPGMLYRPDFILFDTDRCTVIEVFGRDGDPDYDAHSVDKLAVYAFNGVACVAWKRARKWQGLPRGVRRNSRWHDGGLAPFEVGIRLQRPPVCETEAA